MLLLGSLREGVGKARPDVKSVEDLDKVVFNAVDTLLKDKQGGSDDSRVKLESIQKFRKVLQSQSGKQAKKSDAIDAAWIAKIAEALDALWLEETARAGEALARMDPATVQAVDFRKSYGEAKDDVVGQALLAVALKYPTAEGQAIDRLNNIDPATFSHLAKQISTRQLNDPAKGFGPRICQRLWKTDNYDQICELVRKGLDTTLTAPVPEGETGRGIHSGFAQPVQHLVYKHLRDIDMLDRGDPELKPGTREIAAGSKKILACLEEKGVAQSLTTWADVKGSQLIQDFHQKPGTIWGFEHMREPFVKAAHETAEGATRPLRMLELWDAVSLSFNTPAAFDKLLADPDAASDEFVNQGAAVLKPKLDRRDAKVADLLADPDAYLARFRTDAKAMLMEFAAQMPKSSFGRRALDDAGQALAGEGDKVSNIAGIMSGKMEGGLACKAGLWWAKQVNEPIYYCLDGIDMDEVTDFKKVKNQAITEFIAAGGKPAAAAGHKQVITFTELREILKHWDELAGTVKFVEKGRVLAGAELRKEVGKWRQRMEASNKKAGRTPAPPRDHFVNELRAIDPSLMDRLSPGSEGDMDARDIVKKSGYLVRVAGTRPQILLKYLISRCAVLVKYGLISGNLLVPAARLAVAKDRKEVGDVADELRRHIRACHADFQLPLRDSLMRHPLLLPEAQAAL